MDYLQAECGLCRYSWNGWTYYENSIFILTATLEPLKVPREGAETVMFPSSSASRLQAFTSHHGSYTTWTWGWIRVQRFDCPPAGT